MLVRGSIAALLVAAVGALAAGQVPDGRGGTASFIESTILFSRNGDIHWIYPDGKKGGRLTTNHGIAGNPARSPDGRKVVFDSTYGSTPTKPRLWVVNSTDALLPALAGRPRLLRQPEQRGSFASWSPDGTKIAFSSAGEVFVMNADGSGVVQLTDSPGPDMMPTWSPDGTKIAFVSARDSKWVHPDPRMHNSDDLYVMNADGSGVTRLTFFGESVDEPEQLILAWYPAWAFGKIVFQRYTWPGGDRRIWVMNADGTGLTKLTSVETAYPAWSRSGNLIAYSRFLKGTGDPPNQWDIYTMRPDGSQRTRLTRTTGSEIDLAWRAG